jgi:iron(III) transport system ATP-binding protein
LYRRPVDAALAQFVGEAVLLPGVASAGFADCALGRLALARPGADGPVEVMVRPEQIRLEPVARIGAVKAKVLAIAYFGHDASVQMSLEADMPVTVRIAGHMAPRPGTEAWLSVEGVVMAYPLSAPLVELPIPLASGKSPANKQRASTATN